MFIESGNSISAYDPSNESTEGSAMMTNGTQNGCNCPATQNGTSSVSSLAIWIAVAVALAYLVKS